jgi:predicted metal-dependent hydrolase
LDADGKMTVRMLSASKASGMANGPVSLALPASDAILSQIMRRSDATLPLDAPSSVVTLPMSFRPATTSLPLAARTSAHTPSDITLVIDDLPVHVVRKKQKNMYLRIKAPDGRVEVTAPRTFSNARIASFVRSRRTWIDRKIIETINAHEGEAPHPTQAELDAWRQVVMAFTPPLVERWAAIIGVKPGKLAYRNMVSRWGSCNVKTGRICINIQLAAQPPECLEYVVVHELCHLREANHGPRFHALLDAYLPDWRQCERKLRGKIRR